MPFDLLNLALGSALGGVSTLCIQRYLSDRPSAHPGLADLLLWGSLATDSVVLLKDGRVLLVFEFAGPDPTRATPAELTDLARAFVEGFAPLDDRHVLHLDLIRTPAPPPLASQPPNPILRRIYAEAAEQLAAEPRFTTKARFAITWTPPRAAWSRARHLLLTDAPDRAETALLEHISTFEQNATAAAGRLLGPFRVARLTGADLLGALHAQLTAQEGPVSPPLEGELLDQILATQPLLGGWAPRLGDDRLAVLTLFNYPATATANHLALLSQLPFPLRFSLRFRPLSTHAATMRARAVMRVYNRTRAGAAGGLLKDPDARRDELMEAQGPVALLQDARAAEGLMQTGHRFGYLTPVVILRHQDSETLADQVAQTTKVFADSGYILRPESINAIPAFLGSLAGSTTNDRRALVSLHSVALCAPLCAAWPGPKHSGNPNLAGAPPLFEAPSVGGPFQVDLYHDDVGHALVVGPTGAGKSTLLLHLAATFLRYPLAQVVLFDVGHSAGVFTLANQGVHYDLGSEGPLAFGPFQHLDSDSDFRWAVNWLRALLTLQGITFQHHLTELVTTALRRLQALPPTDRTLVIVAAFLQDATLRDALKAFLPGGAFGDLFNATEDHFDDQRALVTFEIGALLSLSPEAQLPALNYLFHRLERRLTGNPTLIVIDEAWRALMHEVFADFIGEWLRTFRKKNASLVLATQSIAEVVALPSAQALLDAAPSRILLPNAEAALPANVALYERLGLNAAEVATLATARRRRDYLIHRQDGSRLFRLPLGRTALAIYTPPEGQTPQEAYGAALRLREQQPNWLDIWLRRRGVPEETA